MTAPFPPVIVYSVPFIFTVPLMTLNFIIVSLTSVASKAREKPAEVVTCWFSDFSTAIPFAFNILVRFACVSAVVAEGDDA